jgi:hypothetical protein
MKKNKKKQLKKLRRIVKEHVAGKKIVSVESNLEIFAAVDDDGLMRFHKGDEKLTIMIKNN